MLIKSRSICFGLRLVGALAFLRLSDAKVALNKCCEQDEVLWRESDEGSAICVKSNSMSSHEDFWISYNVFVKMTPVKKYMFDFYDIDVQSGGVLVVKNEEDATKTYYNDKNATFCVDFNEGGTKFGIVAPKSTILIQSLYATFQVIGIMSLVVTGAVYLVVTPMRNYHGKALIGHTFSLAMAMTLNACTDHFYGEPVYQYLLNLADFSHLLSHFWLTAMWFNVWCLSRFPKRIKLKNLEFIYTAFVVFAVATILVISRAKGRKFLCLDYFLYDFRDMLSCYIIIIGVFFAVDLGLYTSTFYKMKNNRIEILLNDGNDNLEPLRERARIKENMKRIADLELNEKLRRCCLYLTLIAISIYLLDILIHWKEVGSDNDQLDIHGASKGILTFIVCVCILEHRKIIVKFFKGN